MDNRFLFFIVVFMSTLLLPQKDMKAQQGALIDQRDGKAYPTVTIGNQEWMSENINYGQLNKMGMVEATKYCYDNLDANCDKYGALYTWEMATNVCPEGWRLPNVTDWQALSVFLGVEEAGQKIKAAPADAIPWDGTNETGFNAIPSGAGNGIQFKRLNSWAMYWASDESDTQRAWSVQLDGFWYPQPPKYKNIIVAPYYLKSNLMSVRCIKEQ